MLQQLSSIGMNNNFFIEEISDYATDATLDDILTRLMELHENEDKPPAASEETLEKLPRVNFLKEINQVDCPVCQDEFTEGLELIKLPCGHFYHPDCILKWLKLNGTCPFCRFSLVDHPNTS